MKKFLFFSLMCLMAFLVEVKAQRCAVLEFKAGVGVSQSDVDGISAIFITYFRPEGYTMVERTQIDKVIEEQGFQRSKMTQSQMVRVGEILNVSKIVVGDVNVVFGQYQVDARVINVETGTISATEGATFATSSYRSSMQSVAQKLASKIAITPGSTVPARTTTPSSSRQRTSVETLWGYLKIFPVELGTFSSEPTSVISNINAQAQYGYNNWRIPTNEELSLLRANNYLGSGEYMTREKKSGIVLLVTDGKDYATMQAEEQERIRVEQEKQERIRVEQEKQERIARLKAQGLIDLGLPSGTLWKDKNEEGGFYTYEQAVSRFGSGLPTKEQLKELKNSCKWTWNGNGYKVTGPNGNSIVLPASGYRYCSGDVGSVGSYGGYWSSDPLGSGDAWGLSFYSDKVGMSNDSRCSGRSVRLVQD